MEKPEQGTTSTAIANEDYSKRRISQLEAEKQALGEQLEHDRSLVADCLNRAKKAVSSREWLTAGRGCYEWDDDQWHKEFAQAAEEFLAAIEPTEKIATNWKDCPITAEGIAKARINLQAELEAEKDERIADHRRLLEKIAQLEKELVQLKGSQ